MPALIVGRPGLVLAAVLVLHFLVWWLVPVWFNPNLPGDMLESLAWGAEWQWGYHKHPPLAPWMLAAARHLDPGADWPLYLLSPLCVTIAFWALWRLARDFVDAPRALIAILLLEGVYYHNFTTPEFNPNVVLLPLWALTMLCFWRALDRDSLGAWLLCGLFAALGLLGKYFTLFLIAPMVLLLLTPAFRPLLLRPGPYLAAAVGLLVLAPHVLWALDADFATIGYALKRAGVEAESWLVEHIVRPLRFLVGQLAVLVPVALLVFALGRPRLVRTTAPRRDAFLLALGLGPFVLVFVVAILFGFRLKAMWGTPLLLLSGLMIVAWLPPVIEPARLRRFAWAWGFIFCLAPLAYVGMVVAQPYVLDRAKKVHLPGQALADRLTEAWHARFETPLPIVIGHTWEGGSLAHYAVDAPSLYILGDPDQSPWLDDATVAHRGAVAVWIQDAAGAPADGERARVQTGVMERFPCAERQPDLTLAWQTKADLPPVSIGWTLVPPAEVCDQMTIQ